MSQLSGNSCNIITLFPLGVDCESINASTPVSANGLISLFVTGGTPPYSTTWSNGSQGAYIFNLLPGSYTATTTDYYKDFTATTVCTVGSDSFYLQKFQNCSNETNFIYYLANIPSGFLNNKVYKLSDQEGCWRNKGLVFWSGETYLNYSAVTNAGPYELCKGCLPVPTPTITKPNAICLKIRKGPPKFPIITNNQFFSGSTINGKESWTSSTSPYIVYFNSGTTKWELSGWTDSGLPQQTPYVNSPLGSWNVFGAPLTEVSIYSGSCTSEPSISLDITNSSCEKSNDGSVTINASNGTPPYTYSLNNVTYGASNMYIGLSPGNYTAYVKDITNEIASQGFTVDVDGTEINYIISLIEQPIAIPSVNNIGKFTQITNNIIVSVNPSIPAGKSIELDLIHSVNMSKQTGLYAGSEVTPTLIYSFVTGVTTGALVTGHTSSILVTNNIIPLSCEHANLYTSAYTETFKIVLSGGTFTGQIVKKITTPDATISGCQTSGQINDSFSITNATLRNQTRCDSISKNVKPLTLNLSRTGSLIQVSKL